MNPAGAGTNIIQQALPSPISPISPYASWASSGDEDPLEQFVDALGAGNHRPNVHTHRQRTSSGCWDTRKTESRHVTATQCCGGGRNNPKTFDGC